MSLFSYPIGRETPIKQNLTTTSAVALYTAGKNGGAVLGVRVAEVAGATPNITLDVYNGATSTVVVYQKVFSAKEVYEPVRVDGVPIVLFPNEVLRATASVASQLHITGVAIEPPQRA